MSAAAQILSFYIPDWQFHQGTSHTAVVVVRSLIQAKSFPFLASAAVPGEVWICRDHQLFCCSSVNA